MKQVKPVKKAGDKYADGGGVYLLVKAAGKYWRMDYRYLGRRKTLATHTPPRRSSYRRGVCSPGELRSAEWAEIDLDAAEWRIPGRKMKLGMDQFMSFKF